MVSAKRITFFTILHVLYLAGSKLYDRNCIFVELIKTSSSYCIVYSIAI